MKGVLVRSTSRRRLDGEPAVAILRQCPEALQIILERLRSAFNEYRKRFSYSEDYGI